MIIKSPYILLVFIVLAPLYSDEAQGSESIVIEIQSLLKSNGFEIGTVDGIAGPKTRLAISKFQAQNALSADGVMNADTYQLLKHNSAETIKEKLHLGEFCNYNGSKSINAVQTFTAGYDAEAIVSKIMDVSGLPKNFIVREANVPNAAAVIQGDKRIILYNTEFISEVKRASDTNWVLFSILAHEIGHHLSGHTLSQTGSRPTLELEADKFSGHIMAKLGASLSDAQKAMSLLSPTQGSLTHPGRQERLEAIKTGWSNSCGSNGDCQSNSDAETTRKRGLTFGAVAYSRQGFINGYLGYSKQEAKNRGIKACNDRHKKYCVIVANFTECVAIASPQSMVIGRGPTKELAIREVRSKCNSTFSRFQCDLQVAMCTER